MALSLQGDSKSTDVNLVPTCKVQPGENEIQHIQVSLFFACLVSPQFSACDHFLSTGDELAFLPVQGPSWPQTKQSK